MDAMSDESMLHALWQQLHERLMDKHLLDGPAAALSLRIPASSLMWFGAASRTAPTRIDWRQPAAASGAEARHAAAYRARPDACALATGGGVFGTRLAGFGGAMPGVFDEQVRHLGCMPSPAADSASVAHALRGGANVLLLEGQPMVLGMTAARLALNAELYEKCAQAYVLAAATGGRVRPLPWIVRHVANGRLMKDEKRARRRVQAGLLPEETKGY
jgi:hypothetical protein